MMADTADVMKAVPNGLRVLAYAISLENPSAAVYSPELETLVDRIDAAVFGALLLVRAEMPGVRIQLTTKRSDTANNRSGFDVSIRPLTG